MTRFCETTILGALTTAQFGRKLNFRSVCESTNDVAPTDWIL